MGVKENGSLYFFSAKRSSVEHSCLTVESLSREPSCISAAIRRRLPLASASSGFTFLRQLTVSVSAEMFPLYRPSTRATVFQNVLLPLRPLPYAMISASILMAPMAARPQTSCTYSIRSVFPQKIRSRQSVQSFSPLLPGETEVIFVMKSSGS